MNDALGMIKALPSWPFLNEPIWRWFVFLIAVSLFMHTWRGVQENMK